MKRRRTTSPFPARPNVWPGAGVPIGVRAEGADTVVFTLRAPDREFLSLLSLPAASPCREDFFRETHGRYGLSLGDILGNGRFILSTWDGEYIRLRGRGEDEGTVIRLEPGAEATVYWEEAEAGDYTRVYGILFNQSVPLFSSEAVRAGPRRRPPGIGLPAGNRPFARAAGRAGDS